MKILQNFLSYDDKGHHWPQIFAITVVSLTTMTCGALFCWPSPSIPILTSDKSEMDPITLEEASYLTVVAPIGAIISVPIVAYLADIIGRKKIVASIVFPHFLSWTLIVFAENVYVLYLSRFFAGIADGITFTVVPMYISEITEPTVRGSWGNLISINLYLGSCLVNIIGAYCTIRTTGIIFVGLPLISAAFILLVPESPYFLLMKNNEKEAEVSIQKLKWQENVQTELNSIRKDVNRQISESGTLKDLFTIGVNRKALLLSLAIRASQQFSGSSAFSAYTQYIFNEAGGNISGSTSAIIYSSIMAVMITIFSFVVNKFGRRNLMTYSSLACAIILTVQATYFYIDERTNVDTSNFNWIPLASMLSYIVAFASGLGLIPNLMLGELFSASIKSKALCIVQIGFSTYVLFVSKLFQTLTSHFAMFLPFAIFAACCFLSTIFSYCFVPETKGKTLEEIQQTLRKKSASLDVPV